MSTRAERYFPRHRNLWATAAAAIALIGAATLAAAWAFQIWGGYVPCPLCLQQRIPYYAGVPLAALVAAAALRKPGHWAPRLGLVVVGVIFALGAYLAGYHAGAEWGWWQGPTDCAADLGRATDAGSLLGQLRDVRLVRCDEAPWHFLGLSFAGWNFVISVALAALAFTSAARRPATNGRATSGE